MIVSDYFAELYVAGKFADAGWNVYFPHRDKGFDFIITKGIDNKFIIRPVQVKGKYPTAGKTTKTTYGYVGKLTQMHNDMVLAIPFFSLASLSAPSFVAYMPVCTIKPHKAKGYRCQPAQYKNGEASPRRDYIKFTDDNGLKLVESLNWGLEKE